MKKILLGFAAMFFMVGAYAQNLNTPQASPTQTVKQNFGVGFIELSYSRPSVKGRKIMGDLVPYNEVWRTGANSATTLTFSETVTIGGKEIKAGKYGLLTIPGEKKWTIIITKDVNINNPANYKIENDVVRVEGDVIEMPFNIETFTIDFGDITNTSCRVGLLWERTMVHFEVTTNPDASVMEQIDKVMNKDSKPYYAAASYYYDNGKDKKKALEWVNKALETNKEAYWMYMLKAKIHKDLGDKAAAKTAATMCKDLAAKAKNNGFVKQADELIAGL